MSQPQVSFASLPLMPEWYFLVAVLGGSGCAGLGLVAAAADGACFHAGSGSVAYPSRVAAAKQPLGHSTTVATLSSQNIDRLASSNPASSAAAWAYTSWGWALALGRFAESADALETYVTPSGARSGSHLKLALRRSRECCFAKRAVVKKGGDFDRWDLEIRGGLLGCVRAVAMIEEHGAGKQLFRLRAWPQIPRPAIGLLFFWVFFAALAAYDQAWLAVLVGELGLGIALITRAECAKAMQSLERGNSAIRSSRSSSRLKSGISEGTRLIHQRNRPKV